MTVNKLLTGLIAGAAIGAVAGVLLTPKTGKETRKLLKDRTSELGGKANTSFSNIFRKGRSQEETEEVSVPDNSSSRHGYS